MTSRKVESSLTKIVVCVHRHHALFQARLARREWIYVCNMVPILFYSLQTCKNNRRVLQACEGNGRLHSKDNSCERLSVSVITWDVELRLTKRAEINRLKPWLPGSTLQKWFCYWMVGRYVGLDVILIDQSRLGFKISSCTAVRIPSTRCKNGADSFTDCGARIGFKTKISAYSEPSLSRGQP